ncbi:tRNA pseudouridine(55) synthase TruB [Aliifodinibius sp. S!AR15-10]|uniref:tRNA pseudouridine(55) synthase TruB n=1 Tax=Aliifodinibius sp. S!AR15-10 TaxID=2950437 RepID=UPI0028600CB8|nr:tRNA pseudouridine(55) synthase TruB [Aliifodinibius sp. S!AR15-10]MDR8391547.1 tRNA pseudouridine(55) synthase TruB [Aliifodinibius sp. S!AR15-10]
MARGIPLSELTFFSKDNLPDLTFDFQSGAAFLVDKPKGWTSFDAVKYIRKAVDLRKVGHAGTLDPMATGLLIICCGKATKSIEQIQKLQKEYVAEITFGGSTPSYDAETDVEKTAPYKHITIEKVGGMLEDHFSGTVEQVPPMYSALKYGGKPLYELAREGKEVKRHARQVTIHDTEILDFELPTLKLKIKCGKGTYIRSLAHDLAIYMDSLAYLTALERTAIGEYLNSDALTIEELSKIELS